MALFISDKVDFRTIKIAREKEGHYIMIKGLIHQEDITNLTVYIPNNIHEEKDHEAKINRAEKESRRIQNYSYLGYR